MPPRLYCRHRGTDPQVQRRNPVAGAEVETERQSVTEPLLSLPPVILALRQRLLQQVSSKPPRPDAIPVLARPQTI